MYRFMHKETGKLYTSKHCGNIQADKENGLPMGSLKFLHEIKNNKAGATMAIPLQWNPKTYPII